MMKFKVRLQLSLLWSVDKKSYKGVERFKGKEKLKSLESLDVDLERSKLNNMVAGSTTDINLKRNK